MSPITSLISSMCAQKNNINTSLMSNRPPTTHSPSNANRLPKYSHNKPCTPTSSLLRLDGPTETHTPPQNAQKPKGSFFPESFGLNGIVGKPYNKAIVELMGDGFAKGTIGNYDSALRSFVKFCDKNNVTEELCFPTDERVLCTFLASLNKLVSGSTAKTTLMALKRWHNMHCFTWNGSECHNLMIQGISNNTPAELKHPKWPAVTPRMMSDLSSALDHNDPKDSAILACAKMAFFGQAHLGELLATSQLKHNPSTHPSHNSIIILLNSNAHKIQLPRTKTSQADGESIFLTCQSDPLDPIKVIENHLLVNHSLATSDHLFAYQSLTLQTGRHSLTIKDFMRRVNDVWTSLGHQRVTGHSF
ncbi:hypothetical protein OPQ81_011095 [Rhizoctonia solani]|nr:hypothetical protein OPQ81_011095 [Rhizoctonia solani]